MSKTPLLLIALVAVGLTVSVGAARRHKVTVTVHSNPEGAQLLMNTARTPVGLTPSNLKYEFTGDCATLQGSAVRWASGATAEIATLTLCEKTGKHQQITFERPADAPGFEVDLQVAYQQAALAQLRAQTSALEYAAWLQTLNGAQRTAAAPKPFALCISRDVARGVIYVACQ